MINFIFFAFFISAAVANHHNKPIELNDGNVIPLMGLGTSVKGGAKGDEVQVAVEAAIDAGYRLIDSAQLYQTEDQVGQAIKNKIADGTIKREDIFVITKLWNDKHAKHLVVPALKESLKKLQLSYVDLFLIHWPVEDFPNNTFGETDYLETWQGMEECKELGLAKSIGVSNFNEKQIERVLAHARIRPVANEIEVNPNLTQKKLVRFCRQHGIVVIAYAPLGSIPASKNKRDSPAPHIDDPTLSSIAKRYNKNTVQVVLRYLIDRGMVPIPKSTTASRIKENFDVFDFCLAPEDIQEIDKFNRDYRTIDVPEWRSHKYYPF